MKKIIFLDADGTLMDYENHLPASAVEAVRRARGALRAGVTPDALLTDVEEALEALGELTGQAVREDVTDRIFSKFCVGK